MSNKRSKEFELMKIFFKKTNNLCLKVDSKNNRYLYSKNIKIPFNKILGKSGTSRDGEVYEIEINDIKIAMKIIPLKEQYLNSEISIMNQLNYLVLGDNSPHFNLIYHNIDCNHNGEYKFKNENITGIINEIEVMNSYNEQITKLHYKLSKFSSAITEEKFNNFTNFPKSYQKLNHILNLIKKDSNNHLNNYKKYKTNSLIIFSELSDIDLNTYITKLNKKKNHNDLFISIFKQIVVSLRTMHLKEKIIHLDLHSGNIFLNYIKTPGYWEYKSSKKNEPAIYIKNEGVQVRIADFGRSFFIGSKTRNNKIEIFSKLYKQLKRFFPLHYSDPKIDTFDKFYKMAKVYDLNLWIYTFDLWRIFSSINNTINKNDINLNSQVVEVIGRIIDMAQLLLTTINLYDISKDIKNTNKRSKDKKSVHGFEEFVYQNYLVDLIFDEKFEEKGIKKKNIINKNPYLFI
tara:strand:- start:4876 stop:6252 length:1377 start_codon:yes stop_codon:yes gene_type:complete